MTPEEKAEAIEDLKKFHGIPPHDGFSPLAGDGYFARSIENKYRMELSNLADITGFNKIRNRWIDARQQFIDQEQNRINYERSL